MLRIIAISLSMALGVGFAASPASAQQDCRLLQNCPTPAPSPTPTPRPSPPPRQANPCPGLWQSASRANTVRAYNRYLRQCPNQSRSRDARNRIANLEAVATRAASRTRRVRACNTRYDELSRLASTTNSWASIGDSAFKQRISAWNRECASLTGRSTRGKIASAGERATLNIEMRKWGLTYTQMCGLPMSQVLVKANAQANRSRISSAASTGDSVAQLLEGELVLREGKYATDVRSRGVSQFRSAQARNPRAKVQLAIDNLERIRPQTAAADRLLKSAIADKCGDAYYVAGLRVWGSYNLGDKPGEFGQTKTQLLQTGNTYGSTRSMCTLGILNNSGNFSFNWSRRRAFLNRATALGDPCGKSLLAQYGEPNRVARGQPALGSCANNRDCIRRELRAAFAAKDYGSYNSLEDFLRKTALGGGSANYAEATKVVQEAAANGEVTAMSWLGQSHFFGFAARPKNWSVALEHCLKAANRGSAQGAACTYFVSTNESFGETAKAKDPCSMTWMGKNMLPRFSGDVASLQRSAVVSALNGMNAQKKANLKQLLPKVEFAFATAAQSGKSCAKEGRDYGRVLREFVRPYFFPVRPAARPSSSEPRIICRRNASGRSVCEPETTNNTQNRTQGSRSRGEPVPPQPVRRPSPPTPRPSARTRCNTGPYIVFFDWGSSAVTPEARPILDAAARNYASCGTARVFLAGHTDRSGSAQYNMALSGRKNNSVRSYLISKGIPVSRISSRAFGESQPRVPTPDGVRELQNRRVVITFQP